MAFYDTRIREEELKHRVAADWFAAYDCSRVIGNIDFAVDIPATELALGYAAEPALWAEAKAGVKKDIAESFVQLILTIGRARRADELPPLFLGAFDAEKIAFIPYNAVLDVLGTNDFNWNVTPSNHETKEFKHLHALVSETIAREKMLFDFERDAVELKRFIRVNFRRGRTDVSKLRINKNNFTHIYRKWREAVYPFIDAPWEMLKKNYGIYDRDFYLAEINVDDRDTPDISDDTPAADFYITFRGNEPQPYRMRRKDAAGLSVEMPFGFKPGGLEAYAEFWRRYKRPPKKEYWSFIVKRLDLLVPQDVRERKGSFFTPKIWVEKSQQYLAQALGENWQDEYFIWDCAGGTGNLEAGLTNKYNVFVSTLDQQDVDVIHQTLGDRGAKTLLDSHVFQFDFLNDSFDDVAKMPAALRDIINDSEKRKKLVVYINPPYAEGDSRRGVGRSGVAVSEVHRKYSDQMGYAKRELFVQFLTRIAAELSGCIIGEFSTLKVIQAPKFVDFRKWFQAKLVKAFLAPADTFDNVKGQFPIGFKIWRTASAIAVEKDGRVASMRRPQTVVAAASSRPPYQAENFRIVADVFNADGDLQGTKELLPYDGLPVINDWIEKCFDDDLDERQNPTIGTAIAIANDFQNQRTVRIEMPNRPWNHQFQWQVSAKNLIESVVYLSARLVIPADWLNDRDQFLAPNEGWREDGTFQGDCLTYILFHGQNHISVETGPNHWIPFTEAEVGARDRFASHFMTDFMADFMAGCIRGRVCPKRVEKDGSTSIDAIETIASTNPCNPCNPWLNFSPAAQAVLAAGRELWRYYHAQPDANPNASYYDIRAHFQGRKPNGTMNATSADAKYNELLDVLKSAMKVLARQIEPKVYEYGFLRK